MPPHSTHPPPAPGTEAPSPLRLAHETEPARDLVPRLQIAPYVAADALRLERELGVGHVLAQILVRRGLADPAAARRFLDAREAHDPAAFDGIEQALDLIRGHVAAGRRIVVHGDYDVDGVCATAIMIRALRSLGADASWFLPSRIDDGYGLAAATVERLAQRGTALIVTVDCGITAVDEVAAARAAGMDVVVSDHHAPRADGALPDCPIVHPALSGYPCPTLCGAGVAYKLASALGARSAEDDLDLVALATVADLVPLAGENRRLVREGLAALSATAKPGLRALMAVSRADPSALDTGTLGFRLAPRINAAGRLRRADAGLELLLTEDPVRAKAIAAELDAVNVERRAVEQRILWEAESQVAELGPRAGYVLWSEEWHPGVVGIVASRVVERHHRPAVLVALEGDTGGGSGRSIPGFDLLGALHTGAAHLRRYGGHRAAAGLTIDAAQLDAFRAAFEAHAEAVLTPDLLEPVERVDAVVSGHELGLGLAEELEALEPCGMGNPAPRLLVPGGRFHDVRSMGEGRHARFSVIAGGCAPAPSPSDATATSPTIPPNRWMRRSGSSATRGTGPSSPGSCCAMPSRVRRPPSNGCTPATRRTWMPRWTRSTLCSSARLRRRRAGGPDGPRPPRAQPAGGPRGCRRRRRLGAGVVRRRHPAAARPARARGRLHPGRIRRARG